MAAFDQRCVWRAGLPALGAVLVSVVLRPAALRGAEEGEGAPEETYAEIVAADEPVAWWRFEGENVATAAQAFVGGNAPSLSGRVSGKVRFGQPGPRSERFPLFGDDNRAIALDGKRGFLSIDDPGEESALDFDRGEAITLEAWVNLSELASGRYAYIVGKGRTNKEDFARENQNYALRLHAAGGAACLSFLFRNADNRPGTNEDFHRWTSKKGILPGSGWHHVAVSYEFGKKESLRGYLDGKPVEGKWDLGGATDKAPVVDNDALRIGASRADSGGLTFPGLLDEVAIYRQALSPDRIEARYRAIAPKPYVTTVPLPKDGVLVEIQEKIPVYESWDFISPKPVERYVAPAFGFVRLPQKYSERGFRLERSNPFLIRASAEVELPEGEYQFLVRARSSARLFVDDELLIQTPFHDIPASSHDRVRDVARIKEPHIRLLQAGDNEEAATFASPGRTHRFRLEVFVGGKKKRPELGETCVALRKNGTKEEFRLLAPAADVPLTEEGWLGYLDRRGAEIAELDTRNRRRAAASDDGYWNRRHELARQVVEESSPPEIPSVSNDYRVSNAIDRFIGHRLQEAGQTQTKPIDDWTFLRRAALDVIGTIPTAEQINAFTNDPSENRRARYIDRLLEHPGWADHWMAYWQDVLAENPNILKPSLNNTGPFRWALYEAFLDNKPFDRFATELIMMEGDKYVGAFAGFGMAAQNDAPMAAKAHIIGQAFLGLEMKCARCHDAPFHEFTQKDLFSVAGMLDRSTQKIPETSSIPLSDEAIESLIVTLSLKPGDRVAPEWPFGGLVKEELPESLLRNPEDLREQVAARVTSPYNDRFAKVVVNRMWRRYMGRGLVEPVDDWDHVRPSHPGLLEFLARELVLNDYDLKHIARLILNSRTYQRTAVSEETLGPEETYLFPGPLRRRMTAEQIVDSMFTASEKPLSAGELNMDLDGSRPYSTFLNLGEPTRAWQFTSLSNERDRPSLAFPHAQDFVSLLKAFGWRAARQDPRTIRDHNPTVLQPAVLANGIVGRRLTRLSDDHALTEVALEEQPVEKLVEQVYRRLLTRPPTPEERAVFAELLREGYDEREIPVDPAKVRRRFPKLTGVSWSNHLSPEANRIKIEMERRAEKGDPPSIRLKPDWRERLEDMIWALMNSPEFVFVP